MDSKSLSYPTVRFPGFPKNVPLGMKVICCPCSAPMAISVATVMRTVLMILRLCWYGSLDLLSKNRDRQRVKLDLWAGKVRIETPLTAPTAQIVFLFSRENGTDLFARLRK